MRFHAVVNGRRRVYMAGFHRDFVVPEEVRPAPKLTGVFQHTLPFGEIRVYHDCPNVNQTARVNRAYINVLSVQKCHNCSLLIQKCRPFINMTKGDYSQYSGGFFSRRKSVMSLTIRVVGQGGRAFSNRARYVPPSPARQWAF
jgi:hypothetical protein